MLSSNSHESGCFSVPYLVSYIQKVIQLTQFDKLYADIVRNPKNVKFEDLDKLLIRSGFKCHKQHSGTSHFHYSHPDLIDILSIPYARPVKAIYVKEALDAILKLERSEEE